MGDRKRKEQESAEAISGLKILGQFRNSKKSQARMIGTDRLSALMAG